MAADTSVDYFTFLYNEFSTANLFDNIKTILFYLLITACTIQTFYPIFMIIAMVIRQLGIFAHFFHKVEEKSLRHGGELVAQVLKSHGVQQVFTLSGGHISPILVAAEKQGIKVIDTRHEVTTVFAADAVSRLSGVPGVAVVTAGPGVTNVITALQNASLAETPLVVMCGCPALLLKGRGALQDIDQMSLVKSITKWRSTVTKVRDIIPLVREAFRQAQMGTPGPVLLEFPLDVLYPFSMIQKEVSSMSKSKTLKGKFVNMYLNSYVNNLFAAAFDVEREVKPWPVEIPFPGKNQISQTIDLLKTAKKPLILFGSQAVLPPVGAEELSKLVKQLGIPCYLGGMSRGLLGKDSELHMRQNRKDALREADLVILAGTVADFRLGYGKVLSPKSKIIAVNRSKTQLYKNSDLFWKPTLAVRSDVGQFFLDLVENLQKDGGFKVDKEWINHLRSRDLEKESKNEKMGEQNPNDKYLNPVNLLRKLEGIIDDNTILIADGGDFVATASYILRPRKPLSWLDPGAFGTLGVGGGFALGAKLAKPDANVVILYGDGSLGYSMMEFDTFVRHKIPVTAIIGNDACWTQIAREQVPVLGSDVACKLEYTNYEKAVIPFGANGYMVDGTNEKDLVKIIQEAINKTKGPDGKPSLVNCFIGKSNFRDGSISV